MEPDLSSKLRQPRRTWIPYFVLVVTLLLTGIATYYVALTAKTKDRLRFENAVELTKDHIHNRLSTYITLLRSSSGLFAASDQVTREDFRAYVEQLELRDRYPGIQGIGFSVRVSSAQKDAPMADLRQQLIQNFTIRPAFNRSEYHAIIYLEPLDHRNQVAIGFDMFTEKVRRAAMERARDTGTAAASGKVTLIQEIDRYKQAGFLIYFPVYRNNSNPKTVAQRQAALIGFIYSPFRADDLLQDIVSEDQYSYVDFQVYDGTEISPQNLLHRSNHNNYQSSLTTTTTLNIAGRTWSLVFTSRPEFTSASEAGLVPYIFFGGVAISLVLFGLTRSQACAKTAAEKAVAQMHKSQAALRTSESRFRCLIEADIIGIITADLEGRILEANLAFLQIVGYQRDDLPAGLRWDDLTPPEYHHLDQHARQEIITSGACHPFEKEYIGKDGSRIPVLLGGAIVEGTQDTCIAFVLDLTERKQLEVALRRQTEELVQANRLKDDFLAVISHELRTPLNAMLGWVQLLRSRRLDEAKTAKALEVIERNAKVQTQLIEDLLDTSRLIRGKLHLQMRPVDVALAIAAAINTLQPAAEAKKIEIKSAIASEGVGLVWGDSDRLQQIVWNLLSNAVKFTPDGGQVEVKLNCVDQYVEIQVSDTGIGISPEFLPYVFDRFRQAESATTRSSNGLGLGLAIVRQLVELHGGTVHAASTGSGQGATFIVKLPLWDSVETVITEDLLSRNQTRPTKRIIR